MYFVKAKAQRRFTWRAKVHGWQHALRVHAICLRRTAGVDGQQLGEARHKDAVELGVHAAADHRGDCTTCFIEDLPAPPPLLP
eukprot:scaffold75502_cov32-Tisochrysis_lutea.AAC.2